MTVHHGALIFASDDELVNGTHQLVADGLLAGDRVLVVGGRHLLDVLRSAWDDDPRITFHDQDVFYDSPMVTVAGLQRLLDREGAAGHRVRVTGPVPFGGDPATRRAWMSYEALVDRAFAPYGLTSLCQYDTRVTADDLLAHAWATHDRVVTSSGVAAGGQRRAEVLAGLTAAAVADAPDLGTVLYDDVLLASEDLGRFRTGLIPAPGDLVLAANEVATNAFVHARPPVTVRFGHGPAGWTCVVTDCGPGLPDPHAGIDSPLPGNPQAPGHGLWLVRQLCDRVGIIASGSGTTVSMTLRDRGA
ncbi:MEDS domain-containing protein [Nocardioides sediminis]|uniref:MEDS domain-containing protein n=1 Tax=Nocardioides sediminis TaxID=433648 RepID=UPI00131EE230|nr:MEDS domain-containing protein [Nocardioides sediminis]